MLYSDMFRLIRVIIRLSLNHTSVVQSNCAPLGSQLALRLRILHTSNVYVCRIIFSANSDHSSRSIHMLSFERYETNQSFFFYFPTDVQENSFKKNIQIYIKTAPTCFCLITIIRKRTIGAC